MNIDGIKIFYLPSPFLLNKTTLFQSKKFQNVCFVAGQNAHKGIYTWVPVFPSNLFIATRCSKCVFIVHRLSTTVTCCVISDLLLLHLFQAAAEHAEHVQSVKRALELTDKSPEKMKMEATKEHEGNLLISFSN